MIRVEHITVTYGDTGWILPTEYINRTARNRFLLCRRRGTATVDLGSIDSDAQFHHQLRLLQPFLTNQAFT
jgi:hypothetical protein